MEGESITDKQIAELSPTFKKYVSVSEVNNCPLESNWGLSPCLILPVIIIILLIEIHSSNLMSLGVSLVSMLNRDTTKSK